ncbi:MAG: acetyl-CoA carboxylase biotin carboxylase subunit [Alphaproteobacteria bacterium]|nr:acetyl-CoA carboxylase biotin carboxylase subunit [Alphaproteobacteria bacterium]MCB9792610.1 acetyl-CoA carboxylase biotin carboxylase subunit [Alphaproteobacteria bacterium]
MPPFRKVLVANRGEIALRVIRSCRELGIATVAVYSQADANSLHVRFADESVCIGPPQARGSYLNIPAVLTAADITGADAVHPGYGFLAENAEFADAVQQMGLTFIGPDPDQLRRFGDKLSAKAAARAAGLPLIPGSTGEVGDVEQAIEVAEQVGYPVLLKAAAGGGGKGMRIVERPEEMEKAFRLACGEAEAAFGNGAVFIERFLRRPRHVEIQVAGDRYGVGLHLAERDCSMQRRHQKLVEEAPAPGLSDTLRARIQQAAVNLVTSTGYHTVGTCEFLVEGEEFFFLEVNPRIQVEHPVTEMVTGVDLVDLQIRLAAGEAMPLTQDDVVVNGHAIEARINAEHPFTFKPSPGRITGFHMPGGPGVRVDTVAHEQAFIQPYYDSLVGKLICWAPDRERAIARLLGALNEAVVEGIDTTIPLHRELVASEAFRGVRLSTRYVDTWLAERDA